MLTAACRLVRGFDLGALQAEPPLWEWCGGREGWSRCVGVPQSELRLSNTAVDRLEDTGAMPRDVWVIEDSTLCPVCGRDSCEAHLPAPPVVTPTLYYYRSPFGTANAMIDLPWPIEITRVRPALAR